MQDYGALWMSGVSVSSRVTGPADTPVVFSYHYREENAGVWLKFNKNKDTKIFLSASQTP